MKLDLEKEREAFESLPDIAERLHVATYSESLGFYHAAVLNSGHDVAYVNGAWKAWQAAKAGAVPDGYVLVPIEPTYEMIEAGSDANYKNGGHIESIYEAMIEAAQEQGHE